MKKYTFDLKKKTCTNKTTLLKEGSWAAKGLFNDIILAPVSY